jgi:uncharacterized protein YeaO (DUF488 family)
MPTINLKRIYDPYDKEDGYRILVDRLWPRGIKKEIAHIDKWLKEVAPSNALREEFHHQPEKWRKFIAAYHSDLKGSDAFAELMADIAEHKTVTLLYAAKDTEFNNAVALRQFISHNL